MSNIERKSVYSIRYMLISCQSETYNEVINRVGLKAYGLIGKYSETIQDTINCGH